MLKYLKVISYSHVEGENLTQTGMSKIIEEWPTYFTKTSSEKTHILSKKQLKNAFVTGATFNTELSRKINVSEHQ